MAKEREYTKYENFIAPLIWWMEECLKYRRQGKWMLTIIFYILIPFVAVLNNLLFVSLFIIFTPIAATLKLFRRI